MVFNNGFVEHNENKGGYIQSENDLCAFVENLSQKMNKRGYMQMSMNIKQMFEIMKLLFN